MTTRQILLDVGRCVRAAAAPMLALGVLGLARTAHTKGPTSANVGELFLAGWRAAALMTLLWLLVAVTRSVTQPWRDCRAFHELQRLREMATRPDRALVHVQTTVWSSTAGQHVVVVNVATGATSRVWLPEVTVPIGSFVVLERAERGVNVINSMNAHQVEAGHRHERRYAVTRDQARVDFLEQWDREDALQLIEDTERFLREQQDN